MSIHDLLISNGQQKSLELVGPEDRQRVEMASRVLADENNYFNIIFAGFAYAALPHRKLEDEKIWIRRTKQITLSIEPGTMPGTEKRIGVPYGSRARMILLYLQTRAVQTKSPEIDLGPCMYQWLERMGLGTGGKQYKDVRDQANRISRCLLTFSWCGKEKGEYGFRDERLVESGVMLSTASDTRQGSLWIEKIRLSRSFFDAVTMHGVPVSETAIKCLSGQSSALDVYIWLSYRLHVLNSKVFIPWSELYSQFGSEYARERDFKSRFIPVIKDALAVYPRAVVDIIDEGVVLHPSPPPIQYKQFQVITP